MIYGYVVMVIYLFLLLAFILFLLGGLASGYLNFSKKKADVYTEDLEDTRKKGTSVYFN